MAGSEVSSSTAASADPSDGVEPADAPWLHPVRSTADKQNTDRIAGTALARISFLPVAVVSGNTQP